MVALLLIAAHEPRAVTSCTEKRRGSGRCTDRFMRTARATGAFTGGTRRLCRALTPVIITPVVEPGFQSLLERLRERHFDESISEPPRTTTRRLPP